MSVETFDESIAIGMDSLVHETNQIIRQDDRILDAIKTVEGDEQGLPPLPVEETLQNEQDFMKASLRWARTRCVTRSREQQTL